MARRISVELIGDAASLERAFAHSGAAATGFAETSVKASSTVTEARIAASAKQISSLRADQEAFATASATYVKGSDEQIAASKLLIDTQRRLQVAMGETAVVTGRAGGSAGHAEREVGRFTRGALAGTGVIRGLGRSLAFASGGFLAFAGGATLIRNSVVGAESLEKAQQGLAVAIEHTGGNVAKLTPKYEATAKAAQQFGINQADALTGLERATVLTGNAAKAQRAYQEALVISKATGKDFNAVLTATSKGQEGVTTSLQRYGILIAKGTAGAKQYAQVFARFAGQARANTSASQQFNATLANSEEIIGTGVLPTVNKYLGELGDWLDKMNRSGRLQKDVNGVLHATGDVFHTLGDVIGVVDKVTGSFANTLKLLAAIKLASLVIGWVGSLRGLAAEWGLVAGAANRAKVAEENALRISGAVLPSAVASGTAGAVASSRATRTALSGKEAAAANAAINKSLGRTVEEDVAKGLSAGVAAGAAAGAAKLGGLRGDLAGLASKAITVGIVLSFVPPNKNGKDFLDKLGLGKLGRLPLIGPLDQQIGRFTKDILDLNQKLPSLLRIPLLPNSNAADLRPLTPDKTLKLGADRFVAGSSEAFQALTRAGAHLPDIANVTAKQEVKAANLLDSAAKHSQKVAQAIQNSLVLIDHARAQVDALRPQDSPRFTPKQRQFGRNPVPPPFQAPDFLPPPPDLPKPLPRLTNAVRSFGKEIRVWTNFQLTFAENVSQAKAQLTQGTADDVAAAKEVVARIKRAIDQGHLSGKSLLAALQVESSALSTIWSAEDAAAQKRAQAASAAKAKIQQQIENSIDPIKLEVGLSRAQALGKPLLPYLKELRTAAKNALASGRLSLAQQKEAYDQITSLNQQIKAARTTTSATFTVPARLQLALAKDAALGASQTKDLLKLRAGILKFIRTHKHNIAALTDAYNQLAQVNQQLGSTAQSALGLFKQASTRALTEGLGLTAAQRKALRARLSQLGPGGTVPGTGVGAAGYAIGKDDRPIVIHNKTYLDGREVARNTTKHQQKRRHRNPSQRRGPNAGTSG